MVVNQNSSATVTCVKFLKSAYTIVILTTNIYIKKSIYHNPKVFIISMWGLLQHVSVQRDHIQITNISNITNKTQCYWCYIYIYIYIYKICTNNQFILKGNWGLYKCHFSFVDFVVNG